MNQSKLGTYDNQFSPTNLYGKAVGLLQEFAGSHNKGSVHVDIGCGFGRIAEPLVNALGCEYLGIDVDKIGLKSLSERGHDTLQIDLSDPRKLRLELVKKLRNRKVCSVSFLDCLEHVTNGHEILSEIALLAGEHHAVVVISTPNFLHQDVISKLAVGSWNYTSAGLLDHTHVRLFSEQLFVRMLSAAGLRVAKRDDVTALKSDQHFPAYHPALSDSSNLGMLLHQISSRANPNANVNQFLAACLVAKPSGEEFYLVERNPVRPFLSIVMRTQGRRKQPLSEALLCLMGQDFEDFEIVLVGHNLTVAEQIAVEEVLEDLPGKFRSKIDFSKVEGSGRACPLNYGFCRAKGHYICALDDDDLVFAHYTEIFHELASTSPGKILRAVCVRQDAKETMVQGVAGTAAFGELSKIYPATYDFLQHLSDNGTPNMSAAYPRVLFHEMGLRFDEDLSTAEDWDFFCRCSFLAGVASSEEITSIYRWWKNSSNSQTVEDRTVWLRNREAVMRKHEQHTLILPGSILPRLRELVALEARVNAANLVEQKKKQKQSWFKKLRKKLFKKKKPK